MRVFGFENRFDRAHAGATPRTVCCQSRVEQSGALPRRGMIRTSLGRIAMLSVASLALIAAAGCDPHIDMGRQQRHNPHDESEFYANGASARQLPAGTIPRDGIAQLPLVNVGQSIPLAITRETIDRGQQQFTIFCSACHGQLGNGEGMIVQRGFPRPPSYHIDRLKNAPDSHIYNVISQGYGAMYPFADRIPPEDRWAIVAYVRTLQAADDTAAPDVKAALVGLGDRVGGTSAGTSAGTPAGTSGGSK